jgi:beta-lactamase superfamily II metal-dependent hydrolase
VCDGIDLAGQTCASQGFDGGTLACNANCGSFDTSGCSSSPGGALEVHYIDVGQGDAEFIITPDGYTLLIDAGEDSYGNSVVSYIQGLGYTQIDAVMASHMHTDHLGGLDKVVAALNPSVCYDRGGSYSSAQYTQYNSACSGKRQTLHKGGTINMGPSVTVNILQAGYSTDENGKSIVMKLTYNNLDLLFGGDCTSACEGTFSSGNVEVYKVHHHGSSTSTSQAFITAADPEVSIIEVGAGNTYGHPTQQTLDRLVGVGSDIYRTDQGGTKVLTSDDGTGYSVGGHGYTAS